MKTLIRSTGLSCFRRDFGFTLVELLVVIAVIALLAAMLLPALARARGKAYSTQCLSNLKQVGVALQLYTDDNHEFLPGPVWAGARASYDQNSNDELIWRIATYLGSPSPCADTKVAQAFVCPAYWRQAPGLTSDVTSLLGRKIYLLNDDLDPSPSNRVPPFGYPPAGGAPAVSPQKYSAIDNFNPRSQVFAISDVDQASPSLNPSVTWWTDLPNKPVHGSVRNQVFFDWHAQSVKW
jgi:prepilin-type N-terminal cleavage/methylation domain-containing protein